MDDTDILVVRKMLKTLLDIGQVGLEEDALKEHAELAAGRLLTTVEKDLALKTLQERKWIASYRNPITQRVRWYATEGGKIAYAAL